MAQPETLSSSLPNNNFTKFLAAYGPWDNGNSKYNEYVERFAHACGEESFNITIKKQDKYFKQLQQLIEAAESHVILITGNAGDGKTHFLQKAINEQKLIAPYSDLQEYANQRNNRDARLLHIPLDKVDITVVKDLSDTDNDSKLVKELFDDVQAVLDQAQAQAAQADHGAIPSYIPHQLDKPHIIIIAGNNGKILESFKSKLLTRHGADVYQGLIDKLEQILLSGGSKDTGHPKISIFDMASCIDQETVEEAFNKILGHEKWNKCEGCAYKDKCAIYHNLTVLRHDQVRQRFIDLFHIVHDTGEHLTMRSILMVLSNAVLGCEESSRTNGYWTCSKVVHSSADPKFSHPFDNIFGRNIFGDNKKKIDIPVYQQLAQLEIGEHTSKLFDEFFLSCIKPANNPQFTPEAQDFLANAEVQKLISSLKSNLDEYNNNQDAYDEADFDNSALGKIQKRVQVNMVQLRRAAFFTLKLASNNSFNNVSVTTSCLDPYALTAFKYGQIYLFMVEALKKLLTEGRTDSDISEVNKQLLIGLNRAFTHLMSYDGESLFVSTNNKLNPTAFCVLYSGMKVSLNNVEQNRIVSDQVRLTLSAVTDKNNSNNIGCKLSQDQANESVVVLRYTPVTSAQTVEHIDLKLTPRMFEYLMSLADGSMAISFSHECHDDINAFKDTITAAKNNISQNHLPQAIHNSLSRIHFCKISTEGNITYL